MFLSEIYCDIKGYEGLYKISNFGNTKSFVDNFGNYREKILKPQNIGKYLRVSLSKNKKIKRCFIHRLVLETFVGSCPFRMECRHLDGDPGNNKLDNLCWGTKKENKEDRRRHQRDFTGERNPNSKLIKQDILKIRKLIKENVSIKIIAQKFNISISMIYHIKNKFSWKGI